MNARTPHFRGMRVGGAEPRQPHLPPDRPDWFTDPRRACSMANPDWRLWTSEDKADLNLAARLCRRRQCPFIRECRVWAVENGEQHHVWGGLNLSKSAVRRWARSMHRPKPKPPTPVVAGPPPRLEGAALHSTVRELWAQDKTDRAIGLRVDRHPSEIGKLRRDLGLPSKFGPGGKRRKDVAA